MTFRRTVQPALGISGQTPLLLGNQPTLITPGAGVIARTVGQGFVLDAPLLEPVESMALFRAGAVAAVNLGVWPNTTRGRLVYLRKMTGNLGTAQTTADVANYYRLKVTDSAGAIAVIPMTTANALTYLLDQGIGSILERGFNPPLAALSANAHLGFGIAHAFTAAQTLTLTGLEIGSGVTLDTGNSTMAATAKVRGAILDSTGQVIASAYVSISGAQGNGATYNAALALDRRWPFTQSVIITPGNTYYLVLDIFENGPPVDPGYQSRLLIKAPGTGTAAWTGAAGLLTWGAAYAVDNSGVGQPTPAQLATLNWPAILAGTQTYPPYVQLETGGTNAWNCDYRVLGSPSGLAQLSGDLTFAIDTVGAPVATAAGSDLNLSALITVS